MKISTEREYNRYSIAHGDFDAAIRFIEKAWKYKENQVIFEALVSMAIICHARPFSPNEKKSTALATSRLKLSDFDGLDERDIQLHNKYIDLRNKAIAHSEYEYHPTQFDRETHWTKRTIFTILNHLGNLAELDSLVRKVHGLCFHRRLTYMASRQGHK